MIESVQSAFIEIRQHALRSLLTLLGIVLGCLALVVMTSVMDGVGVSVRRGFADMGFDGLLSVGPVEPKTPDEILRFQGSRGLRVEDAEVVRRGCRLAGLVSARAQSWQLLAERGRNVQVSGVEPSYAELRGRTAAEGRLLSDADLHSGARTCVLGSQLRRDLFGRADCLGRTVTVAGVRFVVVGVGRPLGSHWVQDEFMDSEMGGVMVPVSTYVREIAGGVDRAELDVKIKDPDTLDDARAELERVLLVEHSGIPDFAVENLAAEALQSREEASHQMRSWRIVMTAVAAVTLLVSGIGLLSVLLISLAERTYEIGLRKAMGATDGSILGLFLAESLVLAGLGAAFGVAAGAGVTHLAARGFEDGLPVSPNGIALAVAAALLVGLGFGIGPAVRASRLAVTDALRSAS